MKIRHIYWKIRLLLYVVRLIYFLSYTLFLALAKKYRLLLHLGYRMDKALGVCFTLDSFECSFFYSASVRFVNLPICFIDSPPPLCRRSVHCKRLEIYRLVLIGFCFRLLSFQQQLNRRVCNFHVIVIYRFPRARAARKRLMRRVCLIVMTKA